MKLMKKALTSLLCLMMLACGMPFSAFAAPSYWGYDDYDTIENPGVEDITSFPTTVKKVSATRYSFSSKTAAGTLTVTLDERSWGMFNLGYWTLVDNDGNYVPLHEGTTDWEYVYRTRATASSKMVYSGGNHGNEILVSLEFYNGQTGEKIDLSIGDSATANTIHVIEKSKLLTKPDTDGDEIGYKDKNTDTYTESDVYATVTRKYTIAGPQIKLNVDYNYLKEVWYDLSYTCMFPINKKYGLYCDMYDQYGNKIKHIETLKVGAADYSGPTYNGNAATRAHIYGYVDPRYQFNVTINTPTDSLANFANSYKTSYWDMNTTHNKLYFSKFWWDTPTKVEAGTQLHTECVWQFVFDPDGNPDNNYDSYPKPNLARGKDYEISITNDPVVATGVSYRANLTDGVATDAFAYANDSWFAFSTNKNADKTTGIATVTIPLDKLYNVTSLRLHLGNFSGVKPPKSIKAFALLDGEYKLVGTFGLQSDEQTAYWTELKLAGLNTNSVKLEFTLDGMTAFINEIEVHGGDPIQVENIALRKDYTIKGLYPNAASPNYPDENGITMTDGYIPSSAATYQDKAFIGINVSTDEYKANGYGSITVDLKKSYKVDKFVSHVASSLNSAAGIKAPASVSVFVSDDNATWVEAGTVTPTDSTSIGVVSATVLLDQAVETRYVQFRFVGSSNWIFVSEVEVYGEHTPEKGEILSKGKQYTTTPTTRTDIRVDDGIRLTDGIKGTKDGSGPEYAGWDNIHDNGVDVIIDLGKNYYSDTYTAYYAGGKWGLVSPKEYESIEVYVSDTLDGEYKLVATAKVGDAVLTNGTGNSDETWSTYTLTATAEYSVKGRYVKFHFMHSQERPAMLWIDEVEVSQNKEPATEPETPNPDEPTEPENPTPDEPTEPEYILGDVNDDDKVDSVDYLLVKRACFKTYNLSDVEFVRSDVNCDSAIDSTDYLLVKRIAFGTYKA